MDVASELELYRNTEAETRLWQAVIVSAVEDWVSGGLRTQREAEVYLFKDETDFPEVCRSAGIDAGRLRSRLRKMRDH